MKLIYRKDMFYSESVKAKMNGSFQSPALTDSPKNMADRYNQLQWSHLSIFYNQTHFNELSLDYLLPTENPTKTKTTKPRNCQLKTAHCKLPTAYCLLPTKPQSHSQLPKITLHYFQPILTNINLLHYLSSKIVTQ